MLYVHYQGSVSTALQAIFPEYSWLPWMFCHVRMCTTPPPLFVYSSFLRTHTATGFWQEPSNVEKYFAWFRLHVPVHVTCAEDILFISQKQIRALGGTSLLQKYGYVGSCLYTRTHAHTQVYLYTMICMYYTYTSKYTYIHTLLPFIFANHNINFL